MKDLTERQLQVLIQLSDEEGHSQKDLVEKLGKQKSNMSTMLGYLESKGIVFRKIRLIKNKGSKGQRRSDIPYFIGPKEGATPQERLDVFRLILRDAIRELEPELQKRLLASEYVNSLIKTCGLKQVYEIIAEYLEREGFRRIASQTLLAQQALIDEYIKLPMLMREARESTPGLFLDEFLDETKHLRILFRLNVINSIRFYRKYLAEPFAKLYRYLTTDRYLTHEDFVTEGIRKVVELDLFLSPFTSFPINYPVESLFERPFERLYCDFYICDGTDVQKLISRANIVYSNFIDIASSGVVNAKIDVVELEILLKQYIFYWNVASQTLDSLYDYLKNIDMISENQNFLSPVYYVHPEVTGLQITNLENNKPLLNRIDKNGLNYNSLILSLDDPLKDIRPCNCFEEIGVKTETMLYDEVLTGIKIELNDRIIDNAYW